MSAGHMPGSAEITGEIGSFDLDFLMFLRECRWRNIGGIPASSQLLVRECRSFWLEAV
jgi:hypothetical protein